MKIVVTSTDEKVGLLGEDHPEGVRVIFAGDDASVNALPPEAEVVFTVIIEWSEVVAQGVVAAWLYDKIKGLRGIAKINGKQSGGEEELEGIIREETAEKNEDEKQ